MWKRLVFGHLEKLRRLLTYVWENHENFQKYSKDVTVVFMDIWHCVIWNCYMKSHFFTIWIGYIINNIIQHHLWVGCGQDMPCVIQRQCLGDTLDTNQACVGLVVGQCSRFKSSMPFKCDLVLQNIYLSKQPFKIQPQIENEDVIWSSQCDMPVKHC